MIATRFRSVYWVGGVAVAALGCYLVSQRVAAERASLVKVETAIMIGERQIRALETEIGTRAGMKQIERWNVDVLALSAPKAAQFVSDEAQLASLVQPAPAAMAAPAAVQVAAVDVGPAALPHVTRASYQAPAPAERIAVRASEEPDLVKAKPKDKAAATDKAPAKDKVAAKDKITAKDKATTKEKVTAKDKPHVAEKVRLTERKRSDSDAARARDADDAPRVRSAVFVKPAPARKLAPEKVALLDDKLLGDLGRLARSERTGGKRNR
jgi:hypothetical protein